MNIDVDSTNKKMLKLYEELMAVEEERINGSEGYSVEQTVEILRKAVNL